MLLFEIVRIALAAIRANKLRSMLTTLGMVIGVGAVITMVALGNGARMAVQAQLDALGTDILTIYPGHNIWRGIAQAGMAPLTMDDVEALRARARTLKAVVPLMTGERQVKFGGENANVDIMATTADFSEITRLIPEYGRFFTDQDDAANRRVAILGWEVPGYLGSTALDIVGHEVSIAGVRFEVIGTTQRKGEQPGPDPDETIYIPFNTGRQRIFGREYSDRLRSLTVQLVAPDSMSMALLDIETTLRSQHHLRPGQENDFRILDRSEFLEARSEANRTMGFLLAGIAAISLIVGGIGIMNIMLVSVTERTREIGVRKALGATRRSVLLQFLAEAVTLSLMGGLIGVLFGIASSRAITLLQGWQTLISMEAIVIAVGFSAAVGVFFGVWPARKASRLDPIDALRYE
ncbi:MAG TPA: ABC transporter permease [candidate division Zixibacteria bacterium]|jgi:putative ABC transport system permease protein